VSAGREVVALDPGLRHRLTTVGRFVGGAVLGGVVAGSVFLIMVQGSFRKGYTDLEYNHVLGTAIRGTAEERSTQEALGVVGDTAGPTGLYATFAAAALLLALHGLLVTRRTSWPWHLRALPLWGITILVAGVVFPLYADSRLDTDTGVFWTVPSGALTPLVLIVSSLGFALMGERAFSLISGARWWEHKEEGVHSAMESLGPIEEEPSLELAEERSEQRRMGP
jgi:hypothetical protein